MAQLSVSDLALIGTWLDGQGPLPPAGHAPYSSAMRRLLDDLRTAQAALRSVEWAGSEIPDLKTGVIYRCCPACARNFVAGHGEMCVLAAALPADAGATAGEDR